MSKPETPVYDSEHPLAPQDYAWLFIDDVTDSPLTDWTGNGHTPVIDSSQKEFVIEDGIRCLHFLATGAGWIGNGIGSPVTYWFSFQFKLNGVGASDWNWFTSDNDYNAFTAYLGFMNIEVNGGPTYTGTIPLSTGTWYHLLVSSLNNIVNVYINGVLDFSQDMSSHWVGYNNNRLFEIFTGFIDSVYYTVDEFLDATQAADLYTNHWAAFGGTGDGPLEITLNEPEIIISETFRKSLSTSLFDSNLILEDKIARMYFVSDSVIIEESQTLEKIRPPIELEVYDDVEIGESIFKNSLRHFTLSDSLSIRENANGQQLNYTDPIGSPTIPTPVITNPTVPVAKETYGC